MTFCKRGHIRIPENLYKNRWCRLCRKEWERSPDQKIKQIANQRKSQLKVIRINFGTIQSAFSRSKWKMCYLSSSPN